MPATEEVVVEAEEADLEAEEEAGVEAEDEAWAEAEEDAPALVSGEGPEAGPEAGLLCRDCGGVGPYGFEEPTANMSAATVTGTAGEARPPPGRRDVVARTGRCPAWSHMVCIRPRTRAAREQLPDSRFEQNLFRVPTLSRILRFTW